MANEHLLVSTIRRGDVMPMEKHRYPPDWDEIAKTVKDEAGWKCEECGKQCRKPGEPFDTHKRTLTVAHLNHTPEDCRRENLRALCAPCHLEYDKEHHVETRRRRAKERNERLMINFCDKAALP